MLPSAIVVICCDVIKYHLPLFYLGVAFHLSHDPSSAENVYKRALSLSKNNQTHAILSNLGNLYREQRKLELAKRILSKSLELCPGYAPANNNLGLICVAQGRWEEAIGYFKKALECDPLLDCAQSNLAKAVALSTSHGTTGN